MRLTTICYIEKDEKYLMLYRTKKENDQSHDKWLGVGGKFEENESPNECVVREVKEETGLTLLSYKLRGVMTFVSDIWETEYMFIYTADRFEGELTECSEGELLWVEKSKVPDLNRCEGDILFLKKLMEDSEFFTIKVQYQGEKLIYAVEKSS